MTTTKTTLRTLQNAFLALLLVCAALLQTQAQAASPSGKPTIVLVHGAFAESLSWESVIERLLAKGYPVVAVANPLRGLRSDSAYVSNLVDTIPGPVVMVGHSYGGAVISNAAEGKRNVKGLVFVAAFAPDSGEALGELGARFPGSTLGSALVPVALPSGGKDLYVQQAKYREQVAGDVPEIVAALLAATQRPVAEAAFTEKAGAPAWKETALQVHLRHGRQGHRAAAARIHGGTRGLEAHRCGSGRVARRAGIACRRSCRPDRRSGRRLND